MKVESVVQSNPTSLQEIIGERREVRYPQRKKKARRGLIMANSANKWPNHEEVDYATIVNESMRWSSCY
jgi:hypothetical protein